MQKLMMLVVVCGMFLIGSEAQAQCANGVCSVNGSCSVRTVIRPRVFRQRVTMFNNQACAVPVQAYAAPVCATPVQACATPRSVTNTYRIRVRHYRGCR